MFGSQLTNGLTDIQEHQNYLELLTRIPISQECLQKNSDRYFIQQPTNRLTDIQEIQNYLEHMYKHPRNVSKRFQKDISSRTKDMNSLVN